MVRNSPNSVGMAPSATRRMRPLDALRPSWKVLDQRGDGELSAGLVAFKNQRIQTGAGGVDGCCQSGAAGAQDYSFANVCHGLPVSILVRPIALGPGTTPGCSHKMRFMANLTLIYGLRLLPEGEVTEIQDATLKLANGHQAHVTMHVIEGSRQDIEAQLKRSLDAFFEFYPEI